MWWQFWHKREAGEQSAPALDIAFIISEYNRGWVLETICRQIARNWPETAEFVWTKKNRKITAPIPSARVYWFSHFQLLITALEQNPEVRQGRLMVWFTHPSKPEITEAQLVEALNQCHAVIFTCSIHHDDMVAKGVRPEIAHVVLGAADPEVFHVRDTGPRDRIGFVSAYYERKNPELIEAIVRGMPEETFLLVGPQADSMGRTERMWANYPHFDRMRALPNLEYVEADYADYPQYYNRMKVYASLSSLEGGPISLIEALMSGCVPVITDTGFARDVLAEIGKGELVPVDSPAETVIQAIRRAEQLTMDSDLSGYRWHDFTQRLHQISKKSPKRGFGKAASAS